jgi:hypothetical protein
MTEPVPALNRITDHLRDDDAVRRAVIPSSLLSQSNGLKLRYRCSSLYHNEFFVASGKKLLTRQVVGAQPAVTKNLRKAQYRTTFFRRGQSRLPVRRSPSKLCAPLDVSGDCAWTAAAQAFSVPQSLLRSRLSLRAFSRALYRPRLRRQEQP